MSARAMRFRSLSAPITISRSAMFSASTPSIGKRSGASSRSLGCPIAGEGGRNITCKRPRDALRRRPLPAVVRRGYVDGGARHLGSEVLRRQEPHRLFARTVAAVAAPNITVASLRWKRRCAMRPNLRPGEKFPDIELPNQDGELTKLSGLMGGFPTAVVFSRGYY